MKIWSALVSVVILSGLLSPTPGLLAAPLDLPSGPLTPPRVDPRQWSIGGPFSTGTVPLGQAFALRNAVAAKFLRFDGPTPSWQEAATPAFEWSRNGGAAIALLRYMVGPIAIRAQGRYLRSTSPGSRQPVMLSDVPAYEWMVTGGPTGTFVLVAQSVALRNVISGDELVLCPGQAPGALRLSWAGQCGGHARQVQPPTGVSLATPTPHLVPVPVTTVSAVPFYAFVHPGAVQWQRTSSGILYNLIARDYLLWGPRNFGINLVWTSNWEATQIFGVRFVTTPAYFTPPVAIQYCSTSECRGHYLKYGHQTYGINLVWSDTHFRDWEVRARHGAHQGDSVQRGERFALYNRTVRDYLVYCERSVGINLRWVKDCPSRYPANY